MNRRRPAVARRAATALAVPCVAAGVVSSAHLLALLVAAIGARRRSAAGPCDSLKFAVVVPAHDEERQIAVTVRSIAASDYPQAHRRIVVIADNCSDRTAATAAAAGAEVWERRDPARHGKGHALDFAFSRLQRDQRIDAVCVVDADCEISPNLLSALAARLQAGSEAVQAPYLIANPEASQTAAIRWAGFALFNLLRPLGRQRLGVSCGLLGTGMAFSNRLLVRSPWRAFSYAEDREQHLRWVLDGVRVAFAPEAQVRSPAPTTTGGARSQIARWDSGRGGLAIRVTPRLVARSVRLGDLAALDAALEPLLLPQSLLLVCNLTAIALARLAGARPLARWAAAAAVGQVVYVVGGLAVVGAPPRVWRALLSAPGFIGRRVLGASAILAGRGPSEWEPTGRE